MNSHQAAKIATATSRPGIRRDRNESFETIARDIGRRRHRLESPRAPTSDDAAEQHDREHHVVEHRAERASETYWDSPAGWHPPTRRKAAGEKISPGRFGNLGDSPRLGTIKWWQQ
jgi:hypothetical protein